MTPVPLVAVLAGLANPGAEAGVRITLERTACYGLCPVYRVTIDSDGGVVYQGRRFVRVEGTHRTRIDPSAVDALIEEIDRAGFFEMKDEYTAMVTDRPTVVVEVRSGARRKRITDYYGAPAALHALEKRIDDVAGTKRWVYVDPATIRELQAAGRRLPRDQEQKQLRLAAARGDADVVRALLAAGADPNGSPQGGRPLLAARTSDVVNPLVDAGADVNVRTNSGRSALAALAASGETAAIERLLAAGARVNDVDRDGFSALMLAALDNTPAAVEALLSAGADASLAKKSGETALAFAEARLRDDERLAANGTAADPVTRRPRIDERRRIVELLRAAAAR